MNKQALCQLLDEKFEAVIAHIENRPESDFTKMHTEGKWSNGGHLDHLRKSTRAMNKGLEINKLILRFKFGTLKRAELDYDSVTSKYLELSEGKRKAPSGVQPDALTGSDRTRVIDWYRQELTAMKGHINKLSEKQLSKYVLPHPLLGMMSLREMVLWNAMHTEHHLKLMYKYNGDA